MPERTDRSGRCREPTSLVFVHLTRLPSFPYPKGRRMRSHALRPLSIVIPRSAGSSPASPSRWCRPRSAMTLSSTVTSRSVRRVSARPRTGAVASPGRGRRRDRGSAGGDTAMAASIREGIRSGDGRTCRSRWRRRRAGTSATLRRDGTRRLASAVGLDDRSSHQSTPVVAACPAALPRSPCRST